MKTDTVDRASLRTGSGPPDTEPNCASVLNLEYSRSSGAVLQGLTEALTSPAEAEPPYSLGSMLTSVPSTFSSVPTATTEVGTSLVFASSTVSRQTMNRLRSSCAATPPFMLVTTTFGMLPGGVAVEGAGGANVVMEPATTESEALTK